MPTVSSSELLKRPFVRVFMGAVLGACGVEADKGVEAPPSVVAPVAEITTPVVPDVENLEAPTPAAEPPAPANELAPQAIEPQPVATSDAPEEVVHPRRCQPPQGIADNPVTITEGIEWINALLETHGAPLDLLCVVESFHRPLFMFATSSRLSAQPADGVKDPRLFLFTGDAVTQELPLVEAADPAAEETVERAFKGMTMSIVASGFGQFFLEFGQLTALRRSIKAEVEFPVEEPLQEHSPFESLHFGVVTSCGLCHSDETPVFGIKDAVESDAFRPDPDLDVPLETLFVHQRDCDSKEEPYRCEFLDAVLNHGDVRLQTFPPEMPTIFERSRERERERLAELFR